MSGGLHSLATIIKRLEAATSRLEDIASVQAGAPGTERKEVTDGSSTSYPSGSAPLPPPPPPPPPSVAPAAPPVFEDPKSVTAFDEAVIDGKLKPFVELTKSFASASVIDIVGLIEKQFRDLRGFIRLSSSCQKPDQKTIESLLTPLQADIEVISRAKEANRKDRDWFTHISFLSEAGPSIGWVVNPKPGPYINDIKESVAYYGNKVMQEFKSKDPKHVEWVKAFLAILDETRKYVMEYHTTGLSWNSKGVTVAEYQSKTAAPPPPSPPPPPAPTAPAATATGGAAAVFAQLNRGEEVTKGLRKVDKSEMTHKNPTLRASGAVPSSSGLPAVPKKPIKPSKPQALAGKKPAKFALEGNKWLIEYQENERSLTIENVEISQAVFIYGCKNCTVVIKGKVNAVTIANSQNTSVLVGSVVSAISVTHAPSFVIQITGSAPMIQLDSTDSGQIYISKDSLGVEITTAKCSSINVSLPVEGEEEGVFGEHAVPEMLKTVIKGGKLVTSIVEHVG
ncbi:Adenylyl cyclase-associated protein [Hypsizygus marmoreus]|uniref:Adenylyl cyclase-associated protein n=1 Tax=Hypsizygus marmoreus TaxID=39966 RepID=A0A369JV96_HYPMA|nr:Adenylyl cyclase-associated protein [Hypsizygus marmoreus]